MAVKAYQEYLDIAVKDEKTFYKNITDDVQCAIAKSNFQRGIVVVHTLHTTTGLSNAGNDRNGGLMPAGFLVQEDEPCLMEDLGFALDSGAKKSLTFIPEIAKGKRTRLLEFLPENWLELFLEWAASLIRPVNGYRHDDFESRIVNMNPNERKNAEAHIKAAMIRESVVWTFSRGRLDLGRWQDILFCDFDSAGREKRRLKIFIIGE